MKMLNAVVALAALPSLALAQAVSVQSGALFQTLPARSADFADKALAHVLSARTTFNPHVVSVAADSIDASTQTLLLNLDSDLSVDAALRNSYVTEEGLTVWQGNVNFASGKALDNSKPQDEAGNEVTLVRNGNMLTGQFRVQGQLFELRPMFNGKHVLYAVDESQREPDHEQAFIGPVAPVDKATAAGSNAPIAKANTVIRTFVVMTNAAKATLADPVGYVTTAFSETNSGYTRSNVQITNQQAGSLTFTSYAESGDIQTDLNRFAGTTDGVMDGVHALRNTNTADVVLLMTNSATSCGLANAIGATAATAFAVVKTSCAVGNFSFGHEIGHLQGARHNPQNDPTTTPYAYGHGFQDPAGAFRTIMAYPCSGGGACPRLNFWSSDTLLNAGKPTGNASQSNNARVLNNTRATVAGFR
jgi:peptidyl-Asp metalloendopeptidase